ncbi:MAG: EamA family transporter [Cyanothece sp. SIO1E1]|nr:EamA family transporter [Cyanothece sp. SIO1E1]
MQLNFSESKLPIASFMLIAPFFLWGTAMVVMKGVMPHTTPLFMAGMRLLPAGILVLLTAILLNRPQPKSWQAWAWIVLFALVDGALFQAFLAVGLVQTGAGLGSVIIDSQPLAVAIMARILFGELIGLWGWLGLALGVIGISFLGLPDTWLQALSQGSFMLSNGASATEFLLSLFQRGEWLMLLAALSMAAGTIMIRFVCRYTDPIIATGWHMILGGLPLLVLSACSETQQWVYLDLSGWMALAYVTVFGSAIAYGLFFYLASKGSLTSLSALTFLTPVFAILFGSLFLSEVLSSTQWVGAGFALVSIYLINQREFLAKTIRFNHLVGANQVADDSSKLAKSTVIQQDNASLKAESETSF